MADDPKGEDPFDDAPPLPDRIERTEDGVARAFSGAYGEMLRYDHDAKRWYEWSGDHWRRDGTDKAFHFCRELARAASVSAEGEPIARLRKASFAAGVERMARTDPIHATTQASWDKDPWLLGCPGATVDLRDGTSRTPDPANHITRLTAVAPATAADCPLWRAFLDQATGGDEGMIRFLQQWAGYCLTGITREHALVFIYGDGGNGKGTFAGTLTDILGDYAATSAMDTFAASKGDRHTTDIASLTGARMVSATETEEGRPWAEARIKTLTGGDLVSARFMRQDFFTFLPQFKLTLTGNHKPKLSNVDEAARRRFNIVPFTNKPEVKDLELREKLKAEWPNILGWMIAGCLEWQEYGLIRPDVVTKATAEYFEQQDVFGQWLEDECILEPNNHHRWEKTAELFSAWQTYAKAAGEEPGSQNRFAEAMARRRLTKHSKKVEKTTVRCWLGINLQRRGMP